jgi:hypothetical protein
MSSTQYRFEARWNATQAKRIRLVAAARNGDANALAHLKEMVVQAGVFASLSVNTRLAQHENKYVAWTLGERPAGLDSHVDCDIRMRAYVATLDLALFDDLSGHALAEHIKANVAGLGFAKATFTAACLAFDNVGCVDTNMAKMYGVPASFSSWKAYRAAYAKTGWTHTLDQWRAFLTVKGFADSQHDCYFDMILV